MNIGAAGHRPRNIYLLDESGSYVLSRNWAPTVDAVSARYGAGDSAVIGFSCEARVRATGDVSASQLNHELKSRPMMQGSELLTGLRLALSMAGAGTTITCVTDGVFGDLGAARKLVDTARSQGVNVRGVGVGDEAREVFKTVFGGQGQLVSDGWQVAGAL